jgi:outer membrane protein assembly factor BamB
MVRIISILIVVLAMMTGFSQKSINDVFKLKWKSKVGYTTYRTNIIEESGSIFVGSNGNDLNSDLDNLDGVIQIEAKTGKREFIYKSQLLGDNDVTGIALKNGMLYFGTDNYYFYCFDINTQNEVWKFKTPYDVESVPVIADLNSDGKDEVVFCVQHNGMYCLDASSGNPVWILDSISSHQGNVAPLVVDCNNDGVLDVIGGFRGMPNSSKTAGFKMAHYGDYLLAINGKDGTPIWSKSSGAGIHASPFLFKESGEKRIVSIDAYGELQVLNLKGELIKDMGFGYNMYMSPVMFEKSLLLADFRMDFGDEHFERTENGFNKFQTGEASENSAELKGNLSASALVADVLGTGEHQYISVSEEGEMSIMTKNGDFQKIKIPSGSEATPLIKDVDGDGYLEILISSLDGYLYCYETKSKGDVFYGQFRWNNKNLPSN